MVVAFFVCEIINLGSVDLMVIALPKEDQMSYPLYIESVDLMVVALHVYVSKCGSLMSVALSSKPIYC